MERIPHDDLPPKGWVLGRFPDGLYWIDPAAVQEGSIQRCLTQEEKDRIRPCWFLFREFDPRPLDEWHYNFACNISTDEILVYEAMAEAYRQETRSRKHKHRRLLYKAILTASMTGGSVENLLATHPELKALPNLARAVQAYKTAWAKRCHGPRN